MNRKAILSISVVAGTGIYLIINKIHKNKLYAKLINDLNTGQGSGDTFQSLGTLTQSGGALNPSYYSGQSSSVQLTTTEVSDGVKKLNGWIHGLFGTSDQKSIIAYFKGLKSQVQVSQLSDAYQKTYNIALADDLKTVDYTLFGLPSFSTPYLPQIQSAIQSLPTK